MPPIAPMMSATPGLIKPASRPPAFAYLFLMVLGMLVSGTLKIAHDTLAASNQREVLRVTSPDRRLDAVLVKPIIFASGGRPALYIVPRGEPVPGWGALMRGNFPVNPALVWAAPQVLEMRYNAGCIEGFSNLWHSYDLDSGNYYVEVRLKPGRQFTCLGYANQIAAQDAQPDPRAKGRADIASGK
jgi:hypothetical protein